METEILEDIGLTGAEIKVFLSLIELGSSTAGKVVERSGLHNAVVHRAFHSLAEKGLLTYVLKGKIKEYQPIDPKLLLGFLDEKKERIAKLIPELEAKRALARNKPQATIYQGARGVKELLSLLIDTECAEYCSYGGPQRSDEALGRYFWERFHRTRVERNIPARLLFVPSLEWWGKELAKFARTEVGITKRALEGITETCICGDKVGIIVYLEKPFGFLIHEPEAARSYGKFFDILWGQMVRRL